MVHPHRALEPFARVANQDGALGVLERVGAQRETRDGAVRRRLSQRAHSAATRRERLRLLHRALREGPLAVHLGLGDDALVLAREIEGAAQGEPRVGRGARRRLVREHRPRVARIRARTARGEPVPLVRLALGAAQMRELLRVRGVDEGGRLGLRRELRVRRGHSRRLLRLEHRILRGDLLPLDLFQAKALRLGGGRLLRGQPGGLLLRLLRRLLVLLRLRGKAWTGTSGVRASSSRDKRTTRDTRKRGGGGGRGTDDASGDGRDAPPSRAGGEEPQRRPSETRVPNRAAEGVTSARPSGEEAKVKRH